MSTKNGPFKVFWLLVAAATAVFVLVGFYQAGVLDDTQQREPASWSTSP